jgi:excisionase family DNA binding protein
MNDLMTVPEVAEFLRTSPKGVRDMLHRGKLPRAKGLGRRVLIPREALLKLLGMAKLVASNDSVASKAG